MNLKKRHYNILLVYHVLCRKGVISAHPNTASKGLRRASHHQRWSVPGWVFEWAHPQMDGKPDGDVMSHNEPFQLLMVHRVSPKMWCSNLLSQLLYTRWKQGCLLSCSWVLLRVQNSDNLFRSSILCKNTFQTTWLPLAILAFRASCNSRIVISGCTSKLQLLPLIKATLRVMAMAQERSDFKNEINLSKKP